MPGATQSQTSTALLLVAIMVSAPMLAIQTAKLGQEHILDGEGDASFTGESDCISAAIQVSEVYPGGSGWIELYNQWSACNIGAWHIADSNDHDSGNDGFEIPDGTVIDAQGFLVLHYSSDFSFYIDSGEDGLWLGARDVPSGDYELRTWWDADSRDGHGWDSSRDGSWERCGDLEYVSAGLTREQDRRSLDSYYYHQGWVQGADWNEPNETTQGSSNLCNGEPIVLRSLHGSGEDDPLSVNNHSAELAWNTDNLVAGQTYVIEYSWETQFGSFSDSETFDADGSELPFSLQSMPDYTCWVDISAELKDQSSGQVMEYFDRELGVDSCIDTTNLEFWDISTGPDTPIHNLNYRPQYLESCTPICPLPDTNEDGTPDGSGSPTMRLGLDTWPSEDVQYNFLAFTYNDGEVSNLFDETFDSFDYSSLTPAADFLFGFDWAVSGHECELRITVEVSVVVNSILWARTQMHEYELRPACDGTSGDGYEIITLEAFNDTTSTWEDPPESLESGDLQLRWDLGDATEGHKVRFLYNYYSPTSGTDRAYENRRLVNDGYVLSNITVDEFGSNRHIEAWFYHVSVTGMETLTDHYYHDFTVSDAIDGGEAALYAWGDGNGTEDLANGSNPMTWNLTELVPGYEYFIEWFTKKHGQSRHYDIIEWVPQSETELHNWSLDWQGDACDVDVHGYLYLKAVNQEWHTADRESWYHLDSYSRYLDPSGCTGEDDGYQAATLKVWDSEATNGNVTWTVEVEPPT